MPRNAKPNNAPSFFSARPSSSVRQRSPLSSSNAAPPSAPRNSSTCATSSPPCAHGRTRLEPFLFSRCFPATGRDFATDGRTSGVSPPRTFFLQRFGLGRAGLGGARSASARASRAALSAAQRSRRGVGGKAPPAPRSPELVEGRSLSPKRSPRCSGSPLGLERSRGVRGGFPPPLVPAQSSRLALAGRAERAPRAPGLADPAERDEAEA
jgi:hypothetical protein